jgi:hypothetical protein
MEREADDLKAEVTRLNTEAEKLQQVANIARQQTGMQALWDEHKQRELDMLIEWRDKAEAHSDDATEISRLQRRLLAVEGRERAALVQLEEAAHAQRELMLRVHRLDKSRDEHIKREREVRAEAKDTTAHLRRKLHELRAQYAGAVTLEQHQRAAARLKDFLQQRLKLEEELSGARHAREKAEDEAAALELQHSQLQELIAELSSKSEGSVKVVEWHQRMVDARVAEFQHKRRLEHAETRVRQLEAMIKDTEETELSAERELEEMKRTFELRQMHWEKVSGGVDSVCMIIARARTHTHTHT